MEAHPDKRAQNLAIAYSIKRKAQKKKMAEGGMVDDSLPQVDPEEYKKRMATIIKMGKPMAEGGQITDNYQSPGNPHMKDGLEEPEHELAHGYVDHEGDVKRPDAMAMEEDDRKLNQHGEYEQGPDGMMMAEGGQITDNYQSDAHMEDMVGRIMKQRAQHFSKGGQVANESGIGRLSQMADGERNSFDDLVLRDDDMESSYTGANSGDELDDARENKDRSDIVARIMASRRKKDRLPSPA